MAIQHFAQTEDDRIVQSAIFRELTVSGKNVLLYRVILWYNNYNKRKQQAGCLADCAGCFQRKDLKDYVK